MSGVIEDLPYTERMKLVQSIAAALVALLSQISGGRMALADALRQIANKFQTMVSQVRYGLDYAINNRMVVLDDSTVALASA